MTRLYLHAGTHKTGTTTIQNFAAEHRDRLAAQGMLYPDYRPISKLGRSGHHALMHSLADATKTFRPRLDDGDIRRLAEMWRLLADESGASILISSEAAYRHTFGSGNYWKGRERYLRKLAEHLRSFEVTVVLVFRRPDDYIRSLYQENIAKVPSCTQSFKDFRKERTERNAAYYRNAALFREVFGTVTCLTYEDLVAGSGLVSNFFAACGVDVGHYEDPGVLRPSHSVPETFAKRHANSVTTTRYDADAFLDWLRKGKVAEMLTAAYGDGRYDLWESHAARRAYLDSCADEVEALRRDFFPDRVRMFPELVEGTTLPKPDQLPAAIRRKIEKYCAKLAPEAA